MNSSISLTSTLVIAGAALVTYSLRFGGLILADKFPKSGKFKQFMETLPGTILVALVVPEVLSVGIWGVIAATSTALCVWKTKNVFLAMVVGVAIVAISRNLTLV